MAVRPPCPEDVTFANASRLALIGMATWILTTTLDDSKTLAVVAESLQSTIKNQARIELQLDGKFSIKEGEQLSRRVDKLEQRIEAHKDNHPNQ